MKKVRNILIFSIILLALNCNIAMAADWTIEVNGEKLDTEVKIIDGRSLIPLRAVGEALGLEVNWNGEKQAVVLDGSALLSHDKLSDVVMLNCKDNRYYAAVEGLAEKYTPINNGQYRINNVAPETPLYMLVSPVNVEGRIYVPVRLICDSFGAPVTVENGVISIGACFTADGSSAEKIVKLLSIRKNSIKSAKPVPVDKNLSSKEAAVLAVKESGCSGSSDIDVVFVAKSKKYPGVTYIAINFSDGTGMEYYIENGYMYFIQEDISNESIQYLKLYGSEEQLQREDERLGYEIDLLQDFVNLLENRDCEVFEGKAFIGII